MELLTNAPYLRRERPAGNWVGVLCCKSIARSRRTSSLTISRFRFFRDAFSGVGGGPYEVGKRFPRCGEQSVLPRGVVIERIVRELVTPRGTVQKIPGKCDA